MCGIAGLIDFTKSTSLDVLKTMTDALAHRGPDDSGLFYEETQFATIGLGHRRLSIIDLSASGHQPMSFEHYTIIFNGEIYNYREIQHELIELGYQFHSSSDTEVILKAFDKWGTSAVDRFIGMFAFCLYDKKSAKVYIFRDRAGVKPVYFYNKNGVMLFASEIKSFHEHPAFEKKLDHDSLALFLQYNYVPTPYSIFQDTIKIEPGHFLEINLKSKSVTQAKYWDVVDCYNQPKIEISYDEAVEETEKVLRKAFNYRTVADVPVGLFLSGGYDSTAVAALLQSERSDKLKTFTIGYSESDFNEAPDAKKVASFLGTDHTEKYCTAEDTQSILGKLPSIYDEPFADNSVVPTYLVSELARSQVKVALSGDAGDEIFAGYDKFNRSIKFTKYPKSIQSLVSRIMKAIPADKIPVLNNSYNFNTRYEKMREIWQSKDPNVALKVISQFITESEARTYLQKNFKYRNTYFDIANKLNDNNNGLNKLLAVDYKTFLLDNNLTKVDRATMAVSLEGREPFLDHHILEYVSRLPAEYKIRDGENKSILKTIVHKYVPKEIMERPKKPFLAPLNLWFKDKLKEYYYDYLDPKRIQSEGIFTNRIISLRDDYLNGRQVNHQKLWNLLMFQMWKEKWL